jgi:hypothetical protein
MGEMPIPPPFPLFVEDEQVALPAAPAPPVPVPAPRHDNKEGDKADKVESEAEEAPQVYVAPVPAGLGAKATSWDSAAETYLSGALTAMLRIGLGSRPANATGPVVTGRDIVLPHDADPADKAGSGTEDDGAGRVNRRGLGMTMEALAAVYARQGRADLAAQLLVQAVSTVIPPQGSPSLEDRCQAAMVGLNQVPC